MEPMMSSLEKILDAMRRWFTLEEMEFSPAHI